MSGFLAEKARAGASLPWHVFDGCNRATGAASWGSVAEAEAAALSFALLAFTAFVPFSFSNEQCSCFALFALAFAPFALAAGAGGASVAHGSSVVFVVAGLNACRMLVPFLRADQRNISSDNNFLPFGPGAAFVRAGVPGVG